MQKGFTLVEMLVISPLVILMIGAFIAAIVSLTGEVVSTRAANQLAYDVQDALDQIERDIEVSDRFLATNNIQPVAPQGADNDTAKFVNQGAAYGQSLILSLPATTANPLSSARGLIYNANQPNACNAANVNQNSAFYYEAVYFIRNNSLWRRSILPSNYQSGSLCSVPWQQPSCQPGYNPSIQAFCRGNDVELVRGVASNGLFIQYFIDGRQRPIANPTDQNQLSTAVSAAVSINAVQTINDRIVERSGAVRATMLTTQYR